MDGAPGHVEATRENKDVSAVGQVKRPSSVSCWTLIFAARLELVTCDCKHPLYFIAVVSGCSMLGAQPFC